MPAARPSSVSAKVRYRFFEHAIDAIDKTQGLRPFPVEARRNEFVVRDDIGRGHWLFYGREEQASRGGVEFAVLIKILLTVVRIDAAIGKADGALLAGRVLPVERRRQANDERAGLAENINPQRRVQRRIVDVADQRRELLIVSHGISNRDPRRPDVRLAVAVAGVSRILHAW